MQRLSKLLFSNLVPILAILVFLIPTYLLRTEMYDGVAIRFAIERDDYSGLQSWFYGQGAPLQFWLFWGIGKTSILLGIHYLFLVKLLLTLVFIGLYFQYSSLLPMVFGVQPWAVKPFALMATFFPSMQIYASSLIANLPVYLLCGLCAYRLVFNDRLPNTQRVFGLILLLFSMQLPSMVTLFIGLSAAALIRSWILKDTSQRLLFRQFLWTIALFIAYIVFRKLMLQPTGMYASYNAVDSSLSLHTLLKYIKAFAMFLTWWTIPITVGVFALLITKLFSQKLDTNPVESSTSLSRDLMATTAAILICWLCAIAPYIAVGKGPAFWTLTDFGSGITEQSIRGVYSGFFAPTFSVTSGRHAITSYFCIALLSYIPLAWLLKSQATRLSQNLALYRSVWCLPILCVLPWSLGGSYNRLEQQHAELALSKGLSQTPKPLPGIVDISYTPKSDWLIQATAANQITQKAWGTWTYYVMAYSFESYRKELLWGYDAFYKQHGGITNTILGKIQALEHFPGEACITYYKAHISDMQFATVLAVAIGLDELKAAGIDKTGSDCIVDRQLVNPYKDRPASY